MQDERRHSRDRSKSRRVLATEREVLLARLLLSLCDQVAKHDRNQEFIELYNSVKALAEPIVRTNGTPQIVS